ncbi:hypothetical protein AB3G45_28880 [Shinella sp. S4-D37]|uniref:hypothetical protein n=1 Tax=Shinella sp. S4-D37 TaxID=3161999 RepID=UPI0034673C63
MRLPALCRRHTQRADPQGRADGAGRADLASWVDAVKSTAYTGWWSCKLFCKRQHQDDSFAVARDLKALMERLILP